MLNLYKLASNKDNNSNVELIGGAGFGGMALLAHKTTQDSIQKNKNNISKLKQQSQNLQHLKQNAISQLNNIENIKQNSALHDAISVSYRNMQDFLNNHLQHHSPAHQKAINDSLMKIMSNSIDYHNEIGKELNKSNLTKTIHKTPIVYQAKNVDQLDFYTQKSNELVNKINNIVNEHKRIHGDTKLNVLQGKIEDALVKHTSDLQDYLYKNKANHQVHQKLLETSDNYAKKINNISNKIDNHLSSIKKVERFGKAGVVGLGTIGLGLGAKGVYDKMKQE